MCSVVQRRMEGTYSVHTNDKGLFGLGSMLVVPWRPASGVDGACAGAQKWRLRLTQCRALPAWGVDRGEESVQRILTTATKSPPNNHRNKQTNNCLQSSMVAVNFFAGNDAGMMQHVHG